MVEELVKLNVPKKNIYVLEDRKTYDLGAFKIKPIETYHDIKNTSYWVDFKPNTMYYATDTCRLPDDKCLKGLSLYCIESNYNEELLEQHLKECEDEDRLYYLQRVSRTHLSSKQATDFLLENMGENSEYCFLHKSSYNYKEID